jgi:hypothetical protein
MFRKQISYKNEYNALLSITTQYEKNSKFNDLAIKRGDYFYILKGELDSMQVWWRCDIKDWGKSIDELTALRVYTISLSDELNTKQQLLDEFWRQDSVRDEGHFSFM